MAFCTCGRYFETDKKLVHHRGNSAPCKAAWLAEVAKASQNARRWDPNDPEEVPRDDEPPGGFEQFPDDFEVRDPSLDGILPDNEVPNPLQDVPPSTASTNDHPSPAKDGRGTSSKQRRLITPHPNRSQTYSRGQTNFEKRKEEDGKRGTSAYRHFENAEVFELAEFMLTSGLSQKEGTRLLRTRAIKRAKARWKNSRGLLRDVDKLPRGPAWKYHTITVTHPNKENCTEEVEFYYRDVLETTKEILGNPDLNHADIMAYEPVEVKVGPEGCSDEDLVHEFGEMHTGEWWNKLQGKLPAGATIAPIILSSDKTQLSVFGGDKSAWPVYLTLGNVAKGTRRQPSKHAVYLLGYLNASKLTFICNKNARSLALKRLFHDSMRCILEPLATAGRDGVMMTCADGFIRKVYPILAAYIADNPEQHLVACTKQSFCPICEVPNRRRGKLTSYSYRKHNRTIKAILSQTKPKEKDLHTPVDAANFATLGLHPIEPFWMGMPFVDVDTLFTPDILHQLHKGMFQTHILNWITTILTAKEIDYRFQALPLYSGLRHFGKGVSHISQMTGKEQKELEKVLMVIAAGGGSIPKQAVVAASGLLNFIYLARLPQHTTKTLELMDQALERFHQYKGIFLRPDLCKNFDAVPKLHSMQHYTNTIRQKGAADGFSTESPERLHIEFAKKGYRASNKNDYLKQMVKWLERQEAVNYMRSYLAWRDGYSSFIDDPGDTEDTDVGSDSQWFLDDDGENGRDTEAPIQDVESQDGPEVITESRSTHSSSTANPIAPAPQSSSLPSLFAVENPLEGHPPGTAHHLTKKPAFFGQSFQTIEDRHQATDFCWYFFEYLKTASPTLYELFDEENTTLDVWKSFRISLPRIRDISSTTISNSHMIMASPTHTREDHLTSRTIPSRFDTVFVRYLQENSGTCRSTSNDIQTKCRVAQVRVIFRISRQSAFFKHHPEPLVYLQYFNRLPSPHKDTGLVNVSRAFRANRLRYAAIVPLSNIYFPCHLTPVFGTSTPSSWLESGPTREDPLESDSGSFLVNSFVTLPTYIFFLRTGLLPLAEDRLPYPTLPDDDTNSDGRTLGDLADETESASSDDVDVDDSDGEQPEAEAGGAEGAQDEGGVEEDDDNADEGGGFKTRQRARQATGIAAGPQERQTRTRILRTPVQAEGLTTRTQSCKNLKSTRTQRKHQHHAVEASEEENEQPGSTSRGGKRKRVVTMETQPCKKRVRKT